MMFGTREEFSYLECAQCGCLQISEFPPDMARHYPPGYYSYSDPSQKSRPPGLKAFLKKQRLKFVLGESRSPLIRLGLAWFPAPEYIISWFRRAHVGADMRILEAGCGNGALLVEMAGEGFRNLTGVDPFVEREIRYSNGVTILKKTLEEVSGIFDFAMLHHAFEHLSDPELTLATLAKLLGPGRTVLLRIPLAAAAWKEYGANWVQLDAPRHFYLHTEKSLSLLAGRTGFKVRDVVYDSTAFQFWGSEQYRMGIPLRDSRSYAVSAAASPFTPERIRGFQEKAEEWNRKREGDQACFFLEVA